MKYDIFISYRRVGGDFSAKQLRDTLENMGYRVFFDVETLRSGEFNVKLLEIIRECRDLIVVLSPDALDRCQNEDDWVRRELECALENNKNIVPILLSGFTFPKNLPASLERLPNYNGIAASPETYDSTIRRLRGFLVSKPSAGHRISAFLRRGPALLVSLVLVIALALGGVQAFRHYTSVYPRTAAQKNLVSETISYMMLNLSHFQTGYSPYMDALDASLEVLDDPSDSAMESLYLEYDHALGLIETARKNIQPCSDTLSLQLSKSPIDKGDLSAFPNALRIVLDGYESTLLHLRDFLMADETLQESTKAAYISACRDMAELDADNMFYCLNETLLPVSESALAEMKTSFLPTLVDIYDGQPWIGSEAEIEGILTRIDNESKNLILEAAYALGDEQRLYDAEQSYLESLQERTQSLDEKRRELEELQAELAAAKQEAYEKFKPLADDEPGILWSKGLRFITLDMPEAAAECFLMFAETEPESYGPVCGQNAAKFVLYMDQTGVTGGCIACFHEDGKPRQAVEVGDIIFGVDYAPISVSDDYTAAVSDKQAHTLNILRFDDEGCEIISVPHDPEGGRIAFLDLNESK